MPRAEIYLEDNGAAADVRFVYPEGFNKDSPAHQMSNVIRKVLDEMFQPLSDRQDTGDLGEMDAELAKLDDLPLPASGE